mmetsp:Transcript_28156/g.73670  ORF Transcript_28156/g.73670 Transcript_28156/m.73670 type:complete len:470 (-) Transcript_28156:81-1490(-)
MLVLLMAAAWSGRVLRLPVQEGKTGAAAAIRKVELDVKYLEYAYRNAYAPFGAENIDDDGVDVESADECMQRCTEDPNCDCVTLQSEPLQCWMRKRCVVDQMTSPYNAGYTVYMKVTGGEDPSSVPTTSQPDPHGPKYVELHDKNAYEGFGAVEIDGIDNTTFGSEEECMQRCTAYPMCGCALFERSTGRCWRRCECDARKMTSPYNAGFTTFMKRGGETKKCVLPVATKFVPRDDYKARVVWSDEFEGDTLDADKWDAREDGIVYNDELQMYKKQGNTHLSDGVLRMSAKCEKYRGYNFTSAKMHSKRLFRAGHRVEARLKMSKGRGAWPAFWLMGNGTDVWPRIGEIDILEYTNCAGEVMGNLHYQNRNGEGALNTYKMPGDDVQKWHQYRIDWTSDGISFFVDDEFVGHAVAHDTYAAWPYNTNEYFIILNLAIGGSLGGFCLKDGAEPECNQTLDVDWVRVSELS